MYSLACGHMSRDNKRAATLICLSDFFAGIFVHGTFVGTFCLSENSAKCHAGESCCGFKN